MTSLAGPLHGISPDALHSLQSDRCLVCHREFGESPKLAHSWSIEEAERHKTKSSASTGAANSSGQASIFQPPKSDLGRVDCATCHREHRGKLTSLKSMSDSACQSCHENQIQSFHLDHPPFEGADPSFQSGLRFNHQTHFNSHFRSQSSPTEGRKAPESCLDCHIADSSGSTMQLRGYAQACGNCHDGDIQGNDRADGAGLVVFGLPALDVWSLEDASHPIGSWPAAAEIVETPISPFMDLLIQWQFPESLASQIAVAELDLLDLSGAQKSEFELVQAWALAQKKFLHSIAVGGQSQFISQIEALAQRSLTTAEAADLLAGLSTEVLESAMADWMPQLASELERDVRYQDENFETPSGELDPVREQGTAAGGWYRQDLDFTIRYRPRGHADPFVRAWIELSGDIAKRTGNPAAERLWIQLVNPKGAGALYALPLSGGF